jgi:hypothetical protein
MLLHAVLALELLNSSGRIDQTLLASIERMALGADFHAHGLERRARLERAAARTGHHAMAILRMDSKFHRHRTPNVQARIYHRRSARTIGRLAGAVALTPKTALAALAAIVMLASFPAAKPTPAAVQTESTAQRAGIGGFAPPSQILFAPILALVPAGPNRAARAIEVMDRAIALYRKIAFHPELGAELQAVVDRLPPRQSTLIRAPALYSSDTIPWSQRPPDQRYIAVSGRPRSTDYLYSRSPVFSTPETAGDFAGVFSLRPTAPLRDGTRPPSVIGELGGQIRLDTFSAAEAVDVGAAILRETYGDLAPPWDIAAGAYNQHDRAAMSRLQRDMPALAERLDHYFIFNNIVDEMAPPAASAPGTPAQPLVIFNLDAIIRLDALKPYPHLAAFYRRVAPIATVHAAIDDEHGHQWLRSSFEHGRIRIVMLDSGGMLTPMDETLKAAGAPLELDRVREGHYHSVASMWVRSFGMDFGLDAISFASDYSRNPDEVTVNSRMAGVPEVIAPPVIHRLMLLIAGDFMRTLANGNDGRGVTSAFSSHRDADGAIRTAGVMRAELRYSPTLEFLARIGDRIAEAHNDAVRREERLLAEDLFNAIVADYERARPRILELDTAATGTPPTVHQQ